MPEIFEYVGPQLGFVIGWWVLGALAVLTVGFYLLGALVGKDEYGLVNGFTFTGAVLTVTFVVLSATFTALHAPFESKYWAYYSVSGEVQSVSNTLVDGSGDITQTNFVLGLDSLEVPVVLDDPRAVSLQGSNVDLRCTIEWVPESADRYNCTIRSIGR